ncbi:hypothetical protein DL93DRAFT_2234099 [Clavulina sp. PMI_390]|nr:hypothetical protein DL93DRAFT_2234099 [Clavulina sp. PMI_390]
MLTNMVEARNLARRELAKAASKLGFEDLEQANDTTGDLSLWISDFETFLDTNFEDALDGSVKRLADANITKTILEAILQISPIFSCDFNRVDSVSESPCLGDFFCSLMELLVHISEWLLEARHRSSSAASAKEMMTTAACVLSMYSLLREAGFPVQERYWTNRPDERRSFLISSLSFLLRGRFSLPDGLVTATASDFIIENSSVLYYYALALLKDLSDHSNASDKTASIDVSALISRSHQNIISHFLPVAADFQDSQHHYQQQLSMLATIVIVDRSDQMLDALASVDYLTPFIAYTSKELLAFQPPTDDALRCCKLLFWSWKIILEASDTQLRTLRLVKAFLDRDIFFLLEAYGVMARSTMTEKKLNPDFSIPS